jgi:hypothetical protein
MKYLLAFLSAVTLGTVALLTLGGMHGVHTQASLDAPTALVNTDVYPDIQPGSPDVALFQWSREKRLLPETPSGDAAPDAAITVTDFAAMLNAEARAYAPTAEGQQAEAPSPLVAHDPQSTGDTLTRVECDGLLRGLYGRDAPSCLAPSSGVFTRRDALAVLKDVLDRHLPDRCVRMPAMKSADFLIDGAMLCDLP